MVTLVAPGAASFEDTCHRHHTQLCLSLFAYVLVLYALIHSLLMFSLLAVILVVLVDRLFNI